MIKNYRKLNFGFRFSVFPETRAPKTESRGFTLIEAVMVMLLVGILAAVIITDFNRSCVPNRHHHRKI